MKKSKKSADILKDRITSFASDETVAGKKKAVKKKSKKSKKKKRKR